jgi:hypothetical protein
MNEEVIEKAPISWLERPTDIHERPDVADCSHIAGIPTSDIKEASG